MIPNRSIERNWRFPIPARSSSRKGVVGPWQHRKPISVSDADSHLTAIMSDVEDSDDFSGSRPEIVMKIYSDRFHQPELSHVLTRFRKWSVRAEWLWLYFWKKIAIFFLICRVYTPFQESYLLFHDNVIAAPVIGFSFIQPWRAWGGSFGPPQKYDGFHSKGR